MKTVIEFLKVFIAIAGVLGSVLAVMALLYIGLTYLFGIAGILLAALIMFVGLCAGLAFEYMSQ